MLFRCLSGAGSESTKKAADQLQDINESLVENLDINVYIGQVRRN